MQDREKTRKPILLLLWLYFWRGIGWLRFMVANILFLLLLIFIAVVIFAPKEVTLPRNAPLLLAPSGDLVDQKTYTSPQAQLFDPAGDMPAETVVREVVDVIHHAANDSDVPGLLLQLDYLGGGGLSKLQEIGAALEVFKATGKPVVAFSDNYSQDQYLLASYADEIHLLDFGGVLVTGFGVYRNYFKETLDKLAVKLHVFKVGEYKDFVEPYTRTDMSHASREHNQRWIDNLWGAYTKQIEQHRGLDDGSVTRFVNHMAENLAATDGDTARLALEMQLVDHVGSRLERSQALIDRFGAMDDDSHQVRHMAYENYRQRTRKILPLAPQNVGLIVASGIILDGYQPDGMIGADSLSELIRQAREDEDIKALVVRIDSGGGSAVASEIIRQELQATRDAGISVVVSMGSVAASGGYWIAMAADEIWSTPTTITGSIGVFGLYPTVDESLAKLGVHTDGVGTTNLAGALRPDRPLPPEAVNIMQQGVEFIYDRFVDLVAQNRNASPEQVHDVAQGRVWTGESAKELGLVDQLGDLEDALDAAATRVGLADYHVKLIERELTTQELILKQLMAESKVKSAVNTLVNDWTGGDTRLLSALSKILTEHEPLINATAPRSTYALCLGCLAP